MKRIAFFTAAAMAFSTAAMAQPRVVVRTPEVSVQWNRERYQGYNDSHWHKDFKGRWSPLATGFNAHTERQFINVGGPRGFKKLRIEGTRGNPVIMKVLVEFADKTQQLMEYRDSFPAGTGEVIDLNGDTRHINRIVVYTDPNSRGSYSVYGA
jgi:hypothetical protein